jgi:glycosyltransferase involved in cell wall biosynthesis
MEFFMTMKPSSMQKPTVSLIVPVYNEAEILQTTWARLHEVMKATGLSHEIIFVNDGSSDESEGVLSDIVQQDQSVININLSRNFGKEYALTAGLDFANGEAIIMIDADLQDPPELIPDMLKEWQNGFDVVTMRRTSRDGETVMKRSSAWLFYRLLNRISDVSIPPDTGDFCLLSARAAEAVRRLSERVRYMKGIFAWIGFRQKEIPYERESRVGGTTKWGYLRLMRFALDGITAFSTTPLRLASYVGFLTAFGAFFLP